MSEIDTSWVAIHSRLTQNTMDAMMKQAERQCADARRAAFDEAAKAIDHALCDVSVDADLFMQVRDHLAGLVRALSDREALT